jgi:hypothetical protein
MSDEPHEPHEPLQPHEQEERRRPPFGLYDSFLEAERDDVYEQLSVRLKWFGEDCLRASERIKDEPRYGLELIEHLSNTVQQLDKIAGSATAKEEAMRQAMSWRIAADDLAPTRTAEGNSETPSLVNSDRRRDHLPG